MSIYKLYGTGITDNLCSLDIVSSGHINAIQWAAYGDLDADNESFAAEVSFSSTSGFTSNDTKSSVSAIRGFDGLLTSGAAFTAVNLFVGPSLGIPVVQGERLYLHATGTSFTGTVYLYVNDGVSSGRPSGRRVRL